MSEYPLEEEYSDEESSDDETEELAKKFMELDQQLQLKLELSPMIKRDDIKGQDNELSDLEEFYLTEIEQQCYGNLIDKLMSEEEKIRKEIEYLQKKLIGKYQRVRSPKKSMRH